MNSLTKEQRKSAIKELKQICSDIGCSGLEPDMCENRPHNCKIIRNILKGG
jgi:hypothetical protein